MSCPSYGHLFCRECAISNLLAQTKDIKRLKKEAEQKNNEDVENRLLEDAEAQAKDLDEFERLQAGLKVQPKSGDEANAQAHAQRGVKRKHDGSGDSSQPKSDSRTGDEDASLRRSAAQVVKRHPACPVAAEGLSHDLSLKHLVTVNFRMTSKDGNDSKRSCPSCDKILSNSTKAVLAKPCGHVLCKSCSDKFQASAHEGAHKTNPTISCYVCQADVTPQHALTTPNDKPGKSSKDVRGLIELISDGTGFAGGGNNMVKKTGLAFQC